LYECIRIRYKSKVSHILRRQIIGATRISWKRKFDYNGVSPNCSDNSKKLFRLLRLQHRRLHLRQLRLVTLGGSPSRTRANYRQRSGARHQLAPECGKSRSRTAISSTSGTRRSQQCSGGSTTTSPPIVDAIVRQQLDYIFVYFDYGRADHAAPDKKLSFPLPRVNYHLLSPHPTLGGSAMNNHLAYH
jgi:hypothetical protein